MSINQQSAWLPVRVNLARTLKRFEIGASLQEMPRHVSQILSLRQELASAAANYCYFVELNDGIAECDDVAKIHKMIVAELDLLEDMAFFQVPARPIN